MSIHYEPLPTKEIHNNENNITVPHHEQQLILHDGDPARYALFDFCIHAPHEVQAGTALDTAINEIKGSPHHLLLITQEDNKEEDHKATHQLQGFVSASDLISSKPMRLMQKKQLAREHVKVCHLMTPISEIPIIAEEDLAHAHIGNIIATLNEKKSDFAICVQDNGVAIGCFSRSFIQKNLKP